MSARLLLLSSLFIFSTVISLSAQQAGETQEVVLSTGEDGPAVLFDGVEISQKDLAALDQSSIGDIKIITGDEAMSTYGKYATYGAIVVTSSAKAEAMNTTITTSTGEVVAPSEREEVKMSFDADTNYHIIINGKPGTMDELRAIPPSSIDQMQVHNGMDAQDLFGKVAQEGAIVVTTKQ